MQLVVADTPPAWAEVHPTPHFHDQSMEKLDVGEEDAIALALELQADMILMDDRDGVRIARSILAMASTYGLLNLAEAFNRIKRTSFHYQQHITDQFLAYPLRTEQ